MALQKVFTQSYVERLKAHIAPADYQKDEFTVDESQVKTLLRVRHPEQLADYMVEHADSDFDCAVALFESYSDLSPVFAQEERFWVYLSHVDLFPYLKIRWSLPLDVTKQNNHIRDHWFKGTNSMMRSSLMGLWWAVYCTVDEERSDRYELTRILFSNYSFRTMFFGASELFWYREGTKGILEFLMDNPDVTSECFENRSLFITKYFNQLGGYKQLASQSRLFYYNECQRIKERILSVRTRDDVQNRSAIQEVITINKN